MRKVSKKAKKYGLIGALIATIIGFLPSLIGGHNDHPIEELAEDLIKQGLCFGTCQDIDIDLSPGASGFFSEDDDSHGFVESRDTSNKESSASNVSRETHLPPLPKPRGEKLNPGEQLPEPYGTNSAK